jgi:hypothetical protein
MFYECEVCEFALCPPCADAAANTLCHGAEAPHDPETMTVMRMHPPGFMQKLLQRLRVFVGSKQAHAEQPANWSDVKQCIKCKTLVEGNSDMVHTKDQSQPLLVLTNTHLQTAANRLHAREHESNGLPWMMREGGSTPLRASDLGNLLLPVPEGDGLEQPAGLRMNSQTYSGTGGKTATSTAADLDLAEVLTKR